MYATDHNMVIHSCAKHSMTLSRDKKSRHRPCKLTLRSKVNVESGSWMYATHPLMVIDPCAKYGKSMSHQKIVKGRTRKQVKNPVNLTLKSKINILSGSWMYRYATHPLMGINPCAKYGKPMSNQKKVVGGTQICTDGQTEWFLFTPLNFIHGGIKTFIKYNHYNIILHRHYLKQLLLNLL